MNSAMSRYVAIVLLSMVPTAHGAGEKDIQLLRTPSGVRFGLLGDKRASPAPTLFVFAADINTTLGNMDYAQEARALMKQGYLAVALDVPCHGQDHQAAEPAGLPGWRARLTRGDDLVPGLVKKASLVLDYLVREGYTDPRRVAASGNSRGGFIALHFAAAEPRVRCVAAFCPVTDLRALTEFAGMEKDPAIQSLALANQADKLADRALWVWIGNQDDRVSTDLAIAFTRKVVAAAAARKKPAAVELHVMPVPGHSSLHPSAHQEAANWLREQTRAPNLGDTRTD
jgi:dienelactone hydrolase